MNFGDLGVILDSEKNQERFYLKKKKTLKNSTFFFKDIFERTFAEIIEKFLKFTQRLW